MGVFKKEDSFSGWNFPWFQLFNFWFTLRLDGQIPKCVWTLSHAQLFWPLSSRMGWGWVRRVSGCRNCQNVSLKKHRNQKGLEEGFKHPGWKFGSWKLPGKQWTFGVLCKDHVVSFQNYDSILIRYVHHRFYCPILWEIVHMIDPQDVSWNPMWAVAKKTSMIYSSVMYFEGRILIPSTSYLLTRSVSTNEHVHFRDGYAASTVAFMVLGLFLPPGKCCTTPERFTRK